VVPAALFDLKSVDGQSTSQWIYSGEQASARRFSATGRSGIHGELKGNLRAVQLSGNEHQLLAGVVKNGDRVDLVANLKVSDNTRAARVVLRDLLVLRAANHAGVESRISTGGNAGYSAVLMVTDAQAPKLLYVASNNDHTWMLQLRPVADAADSPESLTTMPSVLRDGLPRNQAGSGR
jgi:Flp pilus assembly protein CpaB